jgi:chromosome segregation ATPase
MNVMLVAALCMAPMAAQARPIVWLHVPDSLTQRVEGADMALGAEREQVETAKYAIVATQGDREHLKARRRDARADRRVACGDLRDSRRDLRKARRAGNDAIVDARTDAYIESLAEFDRAREHVKWHNALLGVNMAEKHVDQARHAHAVAELEFEQSVLLGRHGTWLMFGPAAFDKQVQRMERKIEARESDVDIAESVASDTKTEYTASNF